MVDLSTSLGLAIFASAMSVAVTLYWIDKQKRIDLSMPFGGSTIPYTIAVIGAGIFAFAREGVIGVASALATAIFFGAIIKGTQRLKQDG